MNKKLLGALVVGGAVAVAVVATRNVWGPLVKAGIQDALIWAIDDPGEDEELEESHEGGIR